MLWVWIGLEKVNDTWTWNGNLVDPLSQGSSWYVLFCFDVLMVNFFCRYDDGYVVVGCWEDIDLRDSAYEGVAEETCNTDHEDTVDACTFANVRPHSEIVPKNV